MPKQRTPAEVGAIARRAEGYTKSQLALALLDLIDGQNRFEIQDMTGLSPARCIELETMQETLAGKFD